MEVPAMQIATTVTRHAAFLTLADMRARYGISDATVDRWVAKGRLPQPVRFGRTRRWRVADIERTEMEQTNT
jgi:predicted DNA-binding transcriptional regulator AlpA